MAIDASIPELDNLADENDKDSNEIEIEEASNDSEKRNRTKNLSENYIRKSDIQIRKMNQT